MLGQWPSEAENIARKALSLVYAALHVRCWVFSFLKERGSHMEVADKTDVMRLCNFPDVGEGHTLVNGNDVAADHLCIDTGGYRAHLTCVGEQPGGALWMAEKVTK